MATLAFSKAVIEEAERWGDEEEWAGVEMERVSYG